MYTADEIDYESLTPETLLALALEVDPFIATSALGELSSRDPAAAVKAARSLLAETSDRYLLGSAATILLDENQPDAVLRALPARLAAGEAEPLLDALAEDDHWLDSSFAPSALATLEGTQGEAAQRVLEKRPRARDGDDAKTRRALALGASGVALPRPHDDVLLLDACRARSRCPG